jgi:predicted phage tail protein
MAVSLCLEKSMGAAEKIDITGAKGGSSSPKQPIEATDSLRSTNVAKLLIAVGEGEFDGAPTARDIYLDNTPINDASGNVNFPNVKWEWRNGAVDQSYIQGIPAVENETTVNVELRTDIAWVRSLTNTQLSAVRIRLAWPALQQQDDEGNVGGYRIEYAIDLATDDGAYQQIMSEGVDGKTTTRYERSRRINLPAATSGWQIRVRRLTPNQNTNKIADTMLVAGYTEVIDAKLRYPNTALLYIEFDAEQFTNIPAVTVDCNGRKWQVPSNYDPVTRSYTGVWDGTFKSAWTNNPAWVTYGICTIDRFGLGKRIKPFMVDKWELYRIAQYCDQLVPNGAGGQEPRFLCDMNLQGRAEAWTLLRDISAIYRGMTYWAQGQLVAQADMPRTQDFDYVFTRANVIDGKFSYGSASTKTRYTRAIVSYDNPANNYDTDVTAFADPDLQRRFGDKPVEISAIGCTRASEAQRRGKWVVMSNNQDRTVTFKTGMEGAIPLPGYIIPVADSLLAGREVGGRISVAAGRVVTLDRDTQAKAGDRLIVNLPSGKAEGRTVQSVAGRAVTVTTAYSETPTPQLQWALDADDLAIPLYRVLSTKRTTEGDYEIAAVQYEPSKFAYIDTGARLEERPISVIPITVVPAPASVTLTSTTAIAQGLAVTTMTITWPAVNGAVAYDVEWRKDNGNWIKVQRTGMTSVDITGIYRGAYLARVRAVSAYDISSIWRSSILTQLNGKEGLPPAVTSLTATALIFGIHLKWTFPPGADDTQRTEIWYGPTTDLVAATKLSDLAYPQSEYNMQGLLAGVTFFFWARLVDRTGNIGPWYPTGIGVMGQSSSEAGPILDMIAGQIGETELGQELQDKIDKIDDLQDQIDALDGLKAYDPDQTYLKGQMVIVDGRIFQAEQGVPLNTPPPNAAYWEDVGDLLETANGLAEQVATNTADISEIDGVLTSQASALQVLRAASRDDDGEGDAIDALRGWNATASFAQEVKVRTTQNSALAQQLTTLDAEVGENSANLTELSQTVATDKEATALALQQLSVEVGDNSAAIQTQSEVVAGIDGKVSSSWSVKMQVTANGQYVAAGIGLGIENGPAGLQSQFLVSADRFAIVNTIAGGAIAVPFAVQGGQVFINQAFIQDGTITNAKIGSFISSTNYVQGQTGWRLNKDGTLEINGAVAGQGRLVVNNQFVAVYDANNTLRVKLGNLS